MIHLTAFLCAILASGGPGWLQQVPETSLEVFDVVEVPPSWTGDKNWLIGFRENWSIDPDRPAIRKRVEEWQPHIDSLNHLSADSAREFFTMMLRKNMDPGDNFHGEVLYEFVMLDPHTTVSAQTGFSVPDSMDQNTRKLQETLIRLIDRHSDPARRFNMKEQLLSVWFREKWEINPVTLEFTREVRSITPVIWQRRRTTDGQGIDEPGTGYPVYYKNQLKPINLRNP